MQPFTPKKTLDLSLRYWWLMAGIILLGASTGWAFHRMRPALYEGRARLTTGIDYTRTGPLTDLEEDQAMQVVGDLIDNTETKQRAVELAALAGVEISLPSFETSAFLERSNYAWVLRYQHSDPQIAQAAVNAWIDAAYSVLQESYSHALMAEELTTFTHSLTSCLENSISSEPVQGLCTVQNLGEIQEELLAVQEAKTAELLASRGLFSGMSFSVTERAALPSQPVQLGRSCFIFTGAVIGFLIAVLIMYWRVPERIWQREDRDQPLS